MNTLKGPSDSAVFQAIPSPAYLAACNGGLKLANPAGQALLRQTPTPNELPVRVQELLKTACDEGREIYSQQLADAVLIRVNERERFYKVDIRRKGDRFGDEDIYLILLTDVTQVRYLSELRASPLATVSHEIKTPITSMHLAVSLLLEGRAGDLNAQQRNLLATAHDDCIRLFDTIDEFLYASGLTLGTAGLEREPAVAAEIVESVIGECEIEAEHHKVELQSVCEGTLPSIQVDRRRLSAALQNLVSNAIRFSPEYQKVIVSVCLKANHFVRFAVLDNGPGVSLVDEEKIFDRFHTGLGDLSPGLGLGLSVAREIVEAHGGALGIDRSGRPPHPFYIDIPVLSGLSDAAG